MPFCKSRKSRKSKKERKNKHKKTRRQYYGGQSFSSTSMGSIAPVGISPYNNLF